MTIAWPTTNEPVSAASVAAFRVLFGTTMAVALVRFWAKGWIDEIYVRPSWHFTWPCFDVAPPPAPAIYGLWFLMVASAVGLAAGARARACAAVFFLTFTYIELCDQAAYLNHYWLVSLVALLLAAVRTDQRFALWPERRSLHEAGAVAPTTLWVLRGQVIAVYLSAALAKVGPDWLLRGEPLRTWLWMFETTPIGSHFITSKCVALGMSWGGFAFDLTVWAFLLWPRTQRLAFAVAVVFHLTVWLLFPIGMFSVIMVSAAALLLVPTWPDDLRRRATGSTTALPLRPASSPRWATPLVAIWVVVQLALPQRHLLVPGHTNWTEHGFRFAWRVMLIEKTGTAEYRVTTAARPEGVRVFPRDELSRLQHRQLVTQPDLMISYAHHLHETFVARGERDVRVFADAWVSLNGRRAQRIIDPAVNLAAVERRCEILPTAEAAVVPLSTAPSPKR